jgi:hypothetical protein
VLQRFQPALRHFVESHVVDKMSKRTDCRRNELSKW